MLWSVYLSLLICQKVYGELDLFGLAQVEVPIATHLVNKINPKQCVIARTVYPNGNHPCVGDIIFEDYFNGSFLNKDKWIVEQYTPITHGQPDYEFVSYEKNDQVLFINNSNLVIKPLPAENIDQVTGTLDLRDGCTSSVEEQCFYKQVSAYILPPVKSAKIYSRFSFAYGKVEIRAKLPNGDWLYPQIQLLPTVKSSTGAKLWVAYSRGNYYYIGPNGDVGSTTLFGGIVLGFDEPIRSRFANKRKSVSPYGDGIHTYTLIWEPEQITVQFDNETYGVVAVDKTDKRFEPFTNQFYISIGVGVGGINDFPDNYTSNNPKPWVNAASTQPKKFFDSRSTWLPTWNKQNGQLHIDSVRVWAV